MSPLVSVLIPVRNRQIMVARALDSALAQTHSDIEIVVVDNCSEDSTYEVVQSYASRDSRVRCYRNGTDIGPVLNWSRCLESSHGDYIQFLFSDDWLEPEAVGRRLEILEKEASTGFAYSAALLHDEERGRSRVLYRRRMSSFVLSSAYLRSWLTGFPHVPFSPGCALFRREDVVAALSGDIQSPHGLRCTSKGFGPDLILYLMACAKYPRLYHIRDPLSHLAGHAGSITASHGRSLRYFCYDTAFAWFLATSDLPRDLRLRLHGLLLLRSLDPARIALVGSRSPWRAYLSLFPRGYVCGDLRLDPRDLAGFAIGVAARLAQAVSHRM